MVRLSNIDDGIVRITGVLDRLLSRPAYAALEQRLGPTTAARRSPDFQKMIY